MSMSKEENVIIEHGIPIPRKRRSVYPLEKLEVGDSIVVPTTSRSIAYNQHFDGKHFISKVLPDDQSKVRIWRIK